MSKDYRVTPKNKKWIVQKIVGRSTVKIPGSPFIKKSDAEAAMFKLIQTFQDKNNPGITFVDAFKKFADMKLDLKNDRNRVTLTSLKRYKMTYDLRIKKYMDHPVTFAKLTTPTLLSNFKLDQMEAFLKAAFDDGVPFKTLRNTVKDIKHFLKQANLRGWNSCRDMETFKIYDYAYVFPKDDSLITKKATNVLDEATCFDLILSAYKTMKNNKHDRDSAMRFAIFSLMFMFGLRASELLGLKKSSIDLQNGFLNVEGVYIVAEGGYLNRLKNKGSRRSIKLDEDGFKFFEIWFYYLDGLKKDNPFLLPGLKGDGPISYKYTLSQVWKGYAAAGLADITVRRDGHIKINSSKLKGHPTKTFRHRFCSKLLKAMHKMEELDQNVIKSDAGHVKFSTTAEIYGDKIIDISEADQKKIASARGKALANNLISQVISKNN